MRVPSFDEAGGWADGAPFDEAEEELSSRPAKAKPAKASARDPMSAAVAALSRREYSRRELREKLSRKFPESAGGVDAALDRLEEKGYLSNSRFAERFVREKASRYGVSRLRLELREKGLASEEIEEALAGLEESDEDRAYRIWEKKFGEPPEDERERGRQARFLASRGFSYSVISRVFDRGRREQEENS